MDGTKGYLERGRRLQGLTDEQLATRWIADFRAWLGSRSAPDDPGNSTEMDDAAAELRLRNVEPPYDQVRDEVKAMVQEVRQAAPDNPAVSEKVREFLQDLDKPRN